VLLTDNIDRVAAADFARYERDDVPVVIEGAISQWPAVSRWTPSELAARIGDVPIRVKRSATALHPDFTAPTLREMFATEPTTFRAFVTEIASDSKGTRLFTGDEKFVLRRRDGVTTIDRELAPLLDDAPVTDLVPTDRLYTVWAWFSGANVRTGLHYDNNGCHNLNAQIAGTKECVLISPDQVDRCGLFPKGGPNPATNCSPVDVEVRDALPEVRAVTARVGPGDLLFIPAWWLHAFRHTGAFNANLNVWWKPDPARDDNQRLQGERDREDSRTDQGRPVRRSHRRAGRPAG